MNPWYTITMVQLNWHSFSRIWILNIGVTNNSSIPSGCNDDEGNKSTKQFCLSHLLDRRLISMAKGDPAQHTMYRPAYRQINPTLANCRKCRGRHQSPSKNAHYLVQPLTWMVVITTLAILATGLSCYFHNTSHLAVVKKMSRLHLLDHCGMLRQVKHFDSEQKRSKNSDAVISC